MKRFFAHTLTLILEFIVLGLAIAWLCSGNGKLEPMIAALTAIAAIVGSFFSRSKDCGKEKKNNNAKTWNNINSPVLQDINASVNIDYSTGKIENSGSGTIIINNIPVDIDTLKAEWTKEDKERIEELKELLATTKELHGRDRLAWDKEKTDLEQKVAYTEAKIQEIIKSYETVDMDSSPMYKEALELFINGKLDEALAVLDDATLEANEKKGADARILKAQMLELKYDFKNAEANYLKAVSIFPSFENNLRIASFYYELNEFKKSEAYLRICVALAKTTKDKACILNNLGVLQRNINELQQAEASYREALQTYRELAANNPQAYLPYVATTLNNLGTLQSYLKDYRKAEAYYQEALKIRRELAAVNPQAYLPDLAMTLNNLGVLQRNINELQQAEASYREALQTYRELAANNPQAYLSDLAVTLNNLGNLQSDIKDYTKAETYHQEALKIRREISAANPQAYLPYVATTLNNLGTLQSYLKDYRKAEAYYQEALKIRRELAAVNPQAYLPDLAMTLNNLGVLQRNINELQQAEASYREALQTYRELAANNPQAYLPDLAMTLNNLGILQSDINDYTKAEASYREALQIRRELAASNPRAYLPDVAMTIASLALFYQADVPDKEQSVRYAEEVLSYRSSIEHIPAAREYIEIAEAALERWQSH